MTRVRFCRPNIRELTSGVDALYLSGRSELSPGLLDCLASGRAAADEQGSPVPFSFGGYDWELASHGLGRYRYRLDHPLAVVGITDKERLPAFRVQARAEVLHSQMGPRGVARWIDSAVSNEALAVSWTVSRLDLHSDVQGWSLSGNDRHKFVCRARALATYEDDGSLSGFTFGNRSSKTINARIYDKTREVAGNGHDWWYEKWGAALEPDSPVLRTEFEFHRSALREMDLHSPDQTLDAIDRVWAYATQDWLTYRRPSAHERAARWPVAPEWERLQRSRLAGNALPMERIRAGRADGALRKLLPGLNGYVAGFASWTGHDTIADACNALPAYLAAYEQQSGTPFTHRVHEKRRQHK